MIYKCFDRKTSGSGIEKIPNKELTEELHKPIIRNFNKRKAHSPFIDNFWSLDLADMQLISKFHKGLRFLLCVIDIYSKYTWVVPLKNQKGITITNTFKKFLDELNRKSNKILVDKGSEFHNRSLPPWSEKKWYRNVFNT